MARPSESTSTPVTIAKREGDSALALSETAISFLAESGFSRVDTPIVEDSELFVRKGGGEMAGLLYTFRGPSGRKLSLRPEFTTSVIRLFVDRGAPAPPIRWSYSGSVFRHERDGGGSLRQFTQVGAEIIGLPSPDVDAQLICTAAEGLGRLRSRAV